MVVLKIDEVLGDSVNLNYFKAPIPPCWPKRGKLTSSLSPLRLACSPHQRFCMSEMSTENLLFWLEVQEYRSIKASDYRAFVARKIYRKYIKQANATQPSPAHLKASDSQPPPPPSLRVHRSR